MSDLPAQVRALPNDRIMLRPAFAAADRELLDLWVTQGIPRDLPTILAALNIMAGLWRDHTALTAATASLAIEGQETLFGGDG